MPPNQICGATATTPGNCSIFCRYASGRKLPRPVACCTTMFAAPLVRPVSYSIASRREDSTTISTRTRTIDAMVRKARLFLRKTFFQMKRKYFIRLPPLARAFHRRRRLLDRQDALVEVQHPMRARRGARIVGHHDDRLVVLGVQPVQEVEDLPRAFRVQVSGRLVGHQDDRVGDERAPDSHAPLLPARELTRLML